MEVMLVMEVMQVMEVIEVMEEKKVKLVMLVMELCLSRPELVKINLTFHNTKGKNKFKVYKIRSPECALHIVSILYGPA